MFKNTQSHFFNFMSFFLFFFVVGSNFTIWCIGTLPEDSSLATFQSDTPEDTINWGKPDEHESCWCMIYYITLHYYNFLNNNSKACFAASQISAWNKYTKYFDLITEFALYIWSIPSSKDPRTRTASLNRSGNFPTCTKWPFYCWSFARLSSPCTCGTPQPPLRPPQAPPPSPRPRPPPWSVSPELAAAESRFPRSGPACWCPRLCRWASSRCWLCPWKEQGDVRTTRTSRCFSPPPFHRVPRRRRRSWLRVLYCPRIPKQDRMLYFLPHRKRLRFCRWITRWGQEIQNYEQNKNCRPFSSTS